MHGLLGGGGSLWMNSDLGMMAELKLSRNPETKQREPDGCWEFDPAGALRALHELDEHMQALREDGESEDEGPVVFEDWLREHGGGRL